MEINFVPAWVMGKQTRRLYVIVDFLDNIHRPALLLKNVSEIGHCLCSQIKKYPVGPNR
jgi:predicted transport protein